MIKLIGTEKQIKWAEKIREKLKKDATESLGRIEETIVRHGGSSKILEKRLKRCEAVLNHIEIETDSAWFIKYSDYPAMAVGKEIIGE